MKSQILFLLGAFALSCLIYETESKGVTQVTAEPPVTGNGNSNRALQEPEAEKNEMENLEVEEDQTNGLAVYLGGKLCSQCFYPCHNVRCCTGFCYNIGSTCTCR